MTDILKHCLKHGEQKHFHRGPNSFRCRKCASENSERSRRKRHLRRRGEIRECILCGYDKKEILVIYQQEHVVCPNCICELRTGFTTLPQKL